MRTHARTNERAHARGGINDRMAWGLCFTFRDHHDTMVTSHMCKALVNGNGSHAHAPPPAGGGGGGEAAGDARDDKAEAAPEADGDGDADGEE